MNRALVRVSLWGALFLPFGGADTSAQETTPPEVRQLVTFKFQPGKTGEAIAVYREQAIPLYQQNPSMLSFRGFGEVESPEALDLIVVSTFQGMAGMDASNAELRAAATRAGTSIGAVYGAIGSLSTSHHDQFVEMLEPLTNGDPSTARLVALVSYQLLPGAGAVFEEALRSTIVEWEKEGGIPSATGRFLISDGWHYLRFIGFESLGAYHDYWSRLNSEANYGAIDRLTVRRKEIVVAPIPELAVR